MQEYLDTTIYILCTKIYFITSNIHVLVPLWSSVVATNTLSKSYSYKYATWIAVTNTLPESWRQICFPVIWYPRVPNYWGYQITETPQIIWYPGVSNHWGQCTNGTPYWYKWYPLLPELQIHCLVIWYIPQSTKLLGVLNHRDKG